MFDCEGDHSAIYDKDFTLITLTTRVTDMAFSLANYLFLITPLFILETNIKSA